MKKGEVKKRLQVTIHPMFIILGLILVIMGNYAVFFICTISAFLHEMGHLVVAEKFGYKMSKIRLMPFGAELHGETDDFDGVDEIYIALAGPIVNFFICLIILGLWWITPRVYGFTEPIFETNLVMGIFNLLPLFPLDGGRIVLSILSRKMTRQDAAKSVKKITRVAAVTMFLCFILTCFFKLNLSLGIMAFMLFFTASSNEKNAVYQRISLIKLVQKRPVKWTILSVPEETRVFELKRLHNKNCVSVFIVIDKRGHELFRFSELDLEKIESRIRPTECVKDLKHILL